MSVTQIKRSRRRPRPRRPGSLMMAKEVAGVLGVEVSNLKDVAGLPAPIDVVTCGRIWDAREIRRFAEEFHARRRRRASGRAA